jgi:hypothetical protein
VAKFSLQRGVFDALHLRINPGELPMGAARNATERALARHRYPLPKYGEWADAEESNYLSILMKIVKFMGQFDQIPMFFAMGHIVHDHEMLSNTQRALRKVFEEAYEFQAANEVKVYSVIDLFFQMRKKHVEHVKAFNPDANVAEFPSLEVAHDEFTRTEDKLRYSADGCDYHNQEDCIQHCALSKVRRYCYTISAYCSNTSKYALIKNCHYPQGYDIKKLN